MTTDKDARLEIRSLTPEETETLHNRIMAALMGATDDGQVDANFALMLLAVSVGLLREFGVTDAWLLEAMATIKDIPHPKGGGDSESGS